MPTVNQARKESMMAEVKWFYRVSELPEALYLMLMEDRAQGALGQLNAHTQFLHTNTSVCCWSHKVSMRLEHFVLE